MESMQIIRKHIVQEFLPDVGESDLATDYDLFANGVVDSLALLRLVNWVAAEFDVALEDLDLSPDNFRTVADISNLVASARG